MASLVLYFTFRLDFDDFKEKDLQSTQEKYTITVNPKFG